MKFYEQLCPVALALDDVGERWSLMIVRDLAMGPLRFSDLLSTNAGIGSNLLAQRLKSLAERGIVTRRTLPPPAGSTIYELTTKGRDLLPVLVELARWGARHGAGTLDAAGLKEAIESRRPVVLAKGGISGEGKFAVRIDGVTVGVILRDGDFEVTTTPPRRPVATLTGSMAQMAGVALGVVSVDDALASGDVRIQGDVDAATRLVRAFLTPLPVMDQAPASPAVCAATANGND
ncbi:MAG: winged helix-turn-helix transcriptional regulator [Acidimicrobiia bacterium]